MRTLLYFFIGVSLSYFSFVHAQEKMRSVEDLKILQQKVRAVVKKNMAATVCIVSPQGASGSGVIISKEGLILTAAHVVRKDEEVEIIYFDGKVARAKVLGVNFSKDAAMLQLVDKKAEHYADLAKKMPEKIGDWVIAMGHSAGYDPLRTPPVRFGRFIRQQRTHFITTDCTLVGGDSGGPLFNLIGELVAIHSNIGKTWSMNNHTLISGFKEDWRELLAGKRWGTLNLNPLLSPNRPVLGIQMRTLSEKGAVIVLSVIPDSPAALAGLRRGDILTHINKTKITSKETFLGSILMFDAGDSVRFKGIRAGKKKEFKVVLGRLDKLSKRFSR